MPVPPYLLFGFDVDEQDPNAAQIIQHVQMSFPILPGMASLGVENVFVAHIAPSQAYPLFHTVANYLWQQHNAIPQLRWFVQLCGTADFAGG